MFEETALTKNIASCLAHSLVFFSREEWLPVADAQNKSPSSSSSQSAIEQQVAAQTGTTGGNVTVAGAGSEGGGGSGIAYRGSLGAGNSGTIDLSSSDPQVVEAALQAGVLDSQNATQEVTGTTIAADQLANSVTGNADVLSGLALASNTQITGNALDAVAAIAGGSEAVSGSDAQAVIAASAANTQMNDAFGEDALDAAENAQATATGDLETESAQYAAGLLQNSDNAQILASQSANGSTQPITTTALPTVGQEKSSISTLGTWVAIIAGILAIYYYVRKGKA